MHVAIKRRLLRKAAFRRSETPRKKPARRTLSNEKLGELRIDKLRAAIRENRISFPSQVPIFAKHDRPDLQRRLVQLYFLTGWTGQAIRSRYGLSRQRFQQILNTWRRRAVELGYIQVVPSAEMLPRSLRRSPMRIVLRCVEASPVALPGKPAAPQQMENRPGNESDLRIGCRPRRKCDIGQIADVLDRLYVGRTVFEVANELGVSPSTVRSWKARHEMRSLSSENAELKKRLAQLSAI